MPSKRPENTAFKQQRLKSWQPLLTPKSVIPSFFIIGLIFIPIGIVLQMASDSVKEVRFDYTKCKTLATETLAVPADSNGIEKWSYSKATNLCTIQIKITEAMNAPVYLYYRLTNFYQNNRKYVKSFDLNQLKGDSLSADAVDSLCDPLRKAAGQTVTLSGQNQSVPVKGSAVYYPCGLIANSLFSDSISSLTCVEGECAGPNAVTYSWTNNSIAWPEDATRYGPSKYLDLYQTDDELRMNVVPPPFWREAFPQWRDGYNRSNFPKLNEWPAFQVWMRTAGLPTFRKLYGRNEASLLPKGTWSLTISQNFDPARYGGSKSIVISTTSLLGGKNAFLGAAYLLTGILCVCLGVAFLIRNMVNPRKLGDHKLLSWNEAEKKKEEPLLQNNN